MVLNFSNTTVFAFLRIFLLHENILIIIIIVNNNKSVSPVSSEFILTAVTTEKLLHEFKRDLIKDSKGVQPKEMIFTREICIDSCSVTREIHATQHNCRFPPKRLTVTVCNDNT